MPRTVLLYLFFVTSLLCNAAKPQTAFVTLLDISDGVYNDSISKYSLTINGKSIAWHEDSLIVSIHYPSIDTIWVSFEKKTRVFLTRFQPGISYILAVSNAYPEDLTILEKEEFDIRFSRCMLNGWAISFEACLNDANETRSKKDPTGTLIFKLKHFKKNTGIIGASYANDMFNLGKGVLLRRRKKIIDKADIYDQISITIGKGLILQEQDIYEDRRFLKFYIEDKTVFQFDGDVESIHYIFLNNETVNATYDFKTGRTAIMVK